MPDIYIVSSSIDPCDVALLKQYAFVKAYVRKPVSTPWLIALYAHYQANPAGITVQPAGAK